MEAHTESTEIVDELSKGDPADARLRRTVGIHNTNLAHVHFASAARWKFTRGCVGWTGRTWAGLTMSPTCGGEDHDCPRERVRSVYKGEW